MKKNIAIVVLFVLVLAGFAACYWNQQSNQEKTAFIQLNTVFTEFEMTKEYQAKSESVQSVRQAILDSLQLTLTSLERRVYETQGEDEIAIVQYNTLKEAFYTKSASFGNENDAMNSQYNTEIYGRLNMYMKEYGENNDYSYIYGAEGSGTIMYADEEKDITQEIIQYINQKYNGE